MVASLGLLTVQYGTVSNPENLTLKPLKAFCMLLSMITILGQLLGQLLKLKTSILLPRCNNRWNTYNKLATRL